MPLWAILDHAIDPVLHRPVGTTVLIGKLFPDQETVARSGNPYHVM